MKLKIVFLLLLLTILSNAPYVFGGADTTKQVLSIAVFGDRYGIEEAAELFEQAHPDVKIEINKSAMRYDSYEEDSERYKAQTLIKLMSGLSEDIIDASGLSYIKLSSGGLLADFYPLMDNDPGFDPEDYYTNVFESLEYGGKLYVFPLDFYYNLVGINSGISNDLISKLSEFSKPYGYEAISVRDMFEIYKSEPDKKGMYVIKDLDTLKLVANSLDQFVDFEGKKCYFNNDLFIDLITDSQAYTEPAISNGNDFTVSAYVNDIVSDGGYAERYFFKSITTASMTGTVYNLLPFSTHSSNPPYDNDGNDTKNFNGFIPESNDNGMVYIYPWRKFSVSNSSSNKELAWEFLRFCTTPAANENIITRLFSVNRREFMKNTEYIISNAITELEKGGYFLPGDKEVHISDCLNILSDYNNMPMIFPPIEDFYEIIAPEINKFVDGSMTAGLTAENLQKKMTMALEE